MRCALWPVRCGLCAVACALWPVRCALWPRAARAPLACSHHFPQQPDPLPNLPLVQPTHIPAEIPAAPVRFKQAVRDTIDSHPALAPPPLPPPLPYPACAATAHLRARVLTRYLNAIAQIFRDRLQQCRPPRRISLPHPPQMPLVHPAGDKLRQRLLLQRRGVQIAQPLSPQ